MIFAFLLCAGPGTGSTAQRQVSVERVNERAGVVSGREGGGDMADAGVTTLRTSIRLMNRSEYYSQTL